MLATNVIVKPFIKNIDLLSGYILMIHGSVELFNGQNSK